MGLAFEITEGHSTTAFVAPTRTGGTLNAGPAYGTIAGQARESEWRRARIGMYISTTKQEQAKAPTWAAK
ncbi:MAG: hypothetical protein GY696_15170 [Gammaproteobacteria bacterium]|nr:hypothetical protein [Gammaproteobacteria bacterium]